MAGLHEGLIASARPARVPRKKARREEFNSGGALTAGLRKNERAAPVEGTARRFSKSGVYYGHAPVVVLHTPLFGQVMPGLVHLGEQMP